MCIFCQIIKGDIPAYKVYEDEHSLAFLDIKPVNPGHTLVIPKKHYSNLEEIPVSELEFLIRTVKKVGRLLKDKLGAPSYNIIENNDPIAGQEIPHLHFHLIPRYGNDRHRAWAQSEYQAGEAEEIIKKLHV